MNGNGNEDNSRILVTLPTQYYKSLKQLKDDGIIPSYASAVRDALIEWLDHHTTVLTILSQET
jgi:Arc/MetJ-type ribon-helix-helix transcriptional regulator